MATLYEMSTEYQEIMLALEEAQTDDELNAAWARFDAIEEDITVKAENYARMMKQMEADEAAYKAEAQRLTKLQHNAEKSVEGLKQRLLDCMQLMGIGEIRTGIGRWKVQQNRFSCKVVDETAIPAEYRKPQPDKIDRAALLSHFNETGEIIPGCEFVRTMGIRFK